MSISSSRSHTQSNPIQVFYPLSTVRCVGPVLFRDQLARDIACLLDVDDDIISWSCRSLAVSHGEQAYKPDFLVKRADVIFVVDGVREDGAPNWVRSKVVEAGFPYEEVNASELPRQKWRHFKAVAREEVRADLLKQIEIGNGHLFVQLGSAS